MCSCRDPWLCFPAHGHGGTGGPGSPGELLVAIGNPAWMPGIALRGWEVFQLSTFSQFLNRRMQCVKGNVVTLE